MTINEKGVIILDSLTKAQLNFLKYCKELGWGKLEVTIKDGEPILAVKKEELIKFD